MEFQKRGLPHVHILVIISEDDRIKISSEVDDSICAKLLKNPNMFKKGTEEYIQAIKLEFKNVVHGPYGNVHSLSPCMENVK